MAKYRVEVEGEGVATVDARTEKEAKTKAFRKLGIKSMLKVKTLTPKAKITKEDSDAVKAFLAKGGKIKKLPPGKAAGYQGKDDPGKNVRGILNKPDSRRMGTRKKVKSMARECVSFKSYINENATAALKKKAEKSGMPLGVLRKVYNRGVAAWRTGHRPGTTPQQWGLARVNSFVTKSSGTWGKADKDLAAKVRGS